ncbi:MAG TPA: hypothetical protein VFA33_06185 [Bryobacteraceae bacterium]|nr:hypothetical protein [Bryobacteraceae bacterium]
MKWFGVTIVEPEEQSAPTPVGAACGFCLEPIETGNRGVIIPHIDTDGESEKPYHFECHMRMVVGSLAHQQRRCSCYGGTEHDPPGMTLRQAARAAFEYWIDHQ